MSAEKGDHDHAKTCNFDVAVQLPTLTLVPLLYKLVFAIHEDQLYLTVSPSAVPVGIPAPVGPCGHVAPVNPVGPCGPVAPSNPFVPLVPFVPAGHVAPVIPFVHV